MYNIKLLYGLLITEIYCELHFSEKKDAVSVKKIFCDISEKTAVVIFKDFITWTMETEAEASPKLQQVYSIDKASYIRKIFINIAVRIQKFSRMVVLAPSSKKYNRFSLQVATLQLVYPPNSAYSSCLPASHMFTQLYPRHELPCHCYRNCINQAVLRYTTHSRSTQYSFLVWERHFT